MAPTDADAAVRLVASGNIDAAAQLLGAENLATKDSLAWYHQSALVLTGRAEELKVAGEFATARQTAMAAVQMLERGDAKSLATAAPADRAQLYMQLGMTYEHFLGDRTSARQCYQLALQLVPNLGCAQAALRSYDAEDARLKRLQGGGN